MINNDNWCFLPKGLQQYLEDRGFGGEYSSAVLGELEMSYDPEGEITSWEDFEWGYSAVLKNGTDWMGAVKKWSKGYNDNHNAMSAYESWTPSDKRNQEPLEKFSALAYVLLLKELKNLNLKATPKALKLADFQFDYEGRWSEDDPDMETYNLKKNIFWKFEINPLFIE